MNTLSALKNSLLARPVKWLFAILCSSSRYKVKSLVEWVESRQSVESIAKAGKEVSAEDYLMPEIYYYPHSNL